MDKEEKKWARLRETQFPGVQRHNAYLNTAVAGIVSVDANKAAADAALKWTVNPGVEVYATHVLTSAREKLAKLLNCRLEQVGLTSHTGDGLNIAAHLLGDDCDDVLCFEDEFATGPIAFMNRGKNLTMITSVDVANARGDLLGALAVHLDAATAENKRVIAVLSAVSYMDGHELDVVAASELCASHEVPLVIDASQAVGVKALDMSVMPGVCFLAAPTYKWLCCGPGLGVIYLSHAMLQRFPSAAPFAGWFGQAMDGINYALGNKHDASRFLVGTPQLTLVPGLCAALNLVESVGGIQVVEARVRSLANRIRRGLRKHGFVLAGAFGVPIDDVTMSRDTTTTGIDEGGHIVGVIVDNPSDIVEMLSERGIYVTSKNRHGFIGLRVAPHLYNNERDCDTFVSVLCELTGKSTQAMASTRNVFGHSLRMEFQMAAGFVQLNHGSYGATPKQVETAARKYREIMENQPEYWFRRDLFTRLDATREKIARYINARAPEDVVFVDNASDGVNAVLRSLATRKGGGGAVLMLNLAYGTTKHCARYLSTSADGDIKGGGFHVHTLDVMLPSSNAQIVALVADFLDTRANLDIRLAEFSHITSSPAMLLPVRELIAVCKSRGVKTLIDGAHALGQVPIDVTDLDCDFYAANSHKWLYTTKGAGILWVSPSEQHDIMPNVLGSRADHMTSFQKRFKYKGLFDYAPYLTMSDALEFRARFGPDGTRGSGSSGDAAIIDYLHSLSVRGSSLLADTWKTDKLVNDEQTAAMANVRLPDVLALNVRSSSPPQNGATGNCHGQELEAYRRRIAVSLLKKYNMYAQLFVWAGQLYVRVSAAIYNDLEDYKALANAVLEIMRDDIGNGESSNDAECEEGLFL